jgi:hypothetical protein
LNITEIIFKLFFWRDKKYIKNKIEAVLEGAQKSGLVDTSSREMIRVHTQFSP